MADVRLVFSVDADTSQGEEVSVEVVSSGAKFSTTVSLKCNKRWQGEAQIPAAAVEDEFQYSYVVSNGSARSPMKFFRLPTQEQAITTIFFKDQWKRKSGSELPPMFSSSLFRDVIFRTQLEKSQEIPRIVESDESNTSFVVRMQVTLPATWDTKRRLYVTGSLPKLGNWNPNTAVPCAVDPETGLWSADVVVSPKNVPFTYKFICGTENRKEMQWENDPNRTITVEAMNDFLQATGGASSSSPVSRILVATEEPFHFGRNYNFKGAGLAVAVSALRSEDSLGVGEFLDIKLVADWASKCGFQLLQILPVNDTTSYGDWRDSSPYSGISVFALHPIYINLPAIGSLSESLLEEIKEEKKRLEKAKLEYAETYHTKMRLIRSAYAEHKAKGLLESDAAYAAFVSKHLTWLVPYAAFSVLRDQSGSSNFSKWGENATMNPEKAIKLAETLPKEEIEAYYFAQYHLHKQLLEASEHAKACKVGLKGDLPIGVNKYSVDTWIYPENFFLNTQTGAPPDSGCFWGQNWELPTYNWEHMARDGYSWWRNRMQHMAQYFHAFRIDHIIGFFRVWSVPDTQVKGLMGLFRPAVPIRKHELENRGMRDMDRLLRPWIRRQHVQESFGGKANEIINRFFNGRSGDLLEFKPEYNTERKIEAALAVPQNAPDHQKKESSKTKETLYSMLDSVILIKDPQDGNAFHPRMRISDSRSFNELPNEWKGALNDLLNDYIWKRQDNLWNQQAHRLLPMMKNTSDMMACAEDLGMVPNCLPKTLADLNILGLRIQRFPTGAEEFAWPGHYPANTVCSTSTHDTPPLRAWWEQLDGGKRNRFFGMLGGQGGAPGFFEPWMAEKCIAQHLESPSIWAVFPIQDIFSMRGDLRRSGHPSDEQVNFPELGENEANWRYRMHMNLDDLVRNQASIKHLAGVISSKGRGPR
mmetsp:Transcript_17129/g.28169  ORF Transcript_17129/g.28169 Transcript_17129/m.28169 type:complete len:928 (-) Transcript_17129:924-3707(-)|eukprot:CAMPEP_0184650628 /NCGR_PEP_ID=MMETSP0308-20130426/8187_1 /TAXON_ID=38269 /ORGANISM="Gloeochaete witrockiana, Strain SAG 46.84" /LENGTH=927 /DNA_ID=CAMNT_0027084305 /DNA_START=134 /DNA_END=2917 /DNA_ORIENTATION=-